MDRCWSPRRVRATPGGPPAGCPGGRRVLPESPGARVEAARPRGRGSPLDPGATSDTDLFEDGRDRTARVTWTGPVLHPDSVRTVHTRREPRSPSPALVDALGGSAAGALTLHCYRASRRAPSPARGPRRRLPGYAGPLDGDAGPVAGDCPTPRPDPGRAGSRRQPDRTPPAHRDASRARARLLIPYGFRPSTTPRTTQHQQQVISRGEEFDSCSLGSTIRTPLRYFGP